jgi:hypothetical protein
MAKRKKAPKKSTQRSPTANRLSLQNRDETLNTCHDCGATPGEYHKLGCDVERCPRCGRQFLQCIWCGGCAESMPNEPWPPPLQERRPYTGEWPGVDECQELGFYAKRDLARGGWVPCGPNEPGAQHDLNRLSIEADWDRREQKFVWTNLTEAFAEFSRRGILGSRGVCNSKLSALETIISQRESSEKATIGAAFYLIRGKWQMLRNQNFPLYTVKIENGKIGTGGHSDPEIGAIVCECLDKYGVEYNWNGQNSQPIQIVTSSISRVSTSRRT